MIPTTTAAPAAPEAAIEGLGAIFLDVLPLPPEAPAKSARRAREDTGEASAPRLSLPAEWVGQGSYGDDSAARRAAAREVTVRFH